MLYMCFIMFKMMLTFKSRAKHKVLIVINFVRQKSFSYKERVFQHLRHDINKVFIVIKL